MRIFTYEEFEVSNGDVKEFAICNNQLGDVCPSEFYINIDKNVNVSIKAYANDDAYIVPKVVNIGTLAKADAIAEAGEYLIMSSPYEKVELTFGGAAKVIVKIVI